MKDAIVGLPRVIRQFGHDGSRSGRVINLKHIWRPIDLVPVFGNEYNEEWSFSTSIDDAEEFFVNFYCDKNTFKHMY